MWLLLCPPLPLLRKLGVRTMREILAERAELIQVLREHRGRPQPTEPIQGGPPLNSGVTPPLGWALGRGNACTTQINKPEFVDSAP